MSSTAAPTPTYPVAYFLHSPHVAPKILQSVLGTPALIKQRKAWLPGYLPAPRSAVSISSTRMGDWQDEDEVRGVVYHVLDAEQEEKLREHAGADCESKEVDFEVCIGGVFGVREWVRGRAFVVSEEGDAEEGQNGVVEEEDTMGAAQPTNASKKEKRKSLFKRITLPLRLRPASQTLQDQSVVVETPRPKPVGLFRHVTPGLSLPAGESDMGAGSSTAQTTEEEICHEEAVVQREPSLRQPSCPQITVTDTSLIHVEDKPVSSAQENTMPDQEHEDRVLEAAVPSPVKEVEKIGAVQKTEMVAVEIAGGTTEAEKIAEVGEPPRNEGLQDELEHPGGVRGIVALYEQLEIGD